MRPHRSPSVEELLGAVEAEEGANEKSKPASTTNTQALLARVQQNRPATRSQRLNAVRSPSKSVMTTRMKDKENIPPTPTHAPHLGVIEAPDSQPELVTNTVKAMPPCTPAEQMINPSTPGAPIQDAVVDHRADIDLPIKGPDFDGLQSQPNLAATAADGAEIEATHDLRLLMQDPNFAHRAPLREFTDLPTDRQGAALESYIGQQLRDPDFFRLCQTIEGVWQRILVYP